MQAAERPTERSPLWAWFHSRLTTAIEHGRDEPRLPWCEHTFALPVRGALAVFRLAAPHVRRQPRFQRFAREVLRLPEAQVDGWYTQAWWGNQAAMACRNRLYAPGRAQEVLDLVEPVDWRPIDALRAEGRGLLICGPHWGVPKVLIVLMANSGRPMMRVGTWAAHVLPGTDLAAGSTPAGYTRLYLQAFQHLRAGGMVRIAPDGPHWRVSVEERFFGHPCRVSLATAALSRITGAPALPSITLWDGFRLRVAYGPVLRSDPDGGEAADRRWMRGYLDWLEAVIAANPTATRFDSMLPRVELPPEGAHVAG